MKITVSVTNARIKIVACAIYTYLVFSYTCSLLLENNSFLTKLDHRPLFDYMHCETTLVLGLVPV